MAVDFYLKVDGIQGESADDNHKDEIQLLSWSLGGTQVTSVAGTGGSGAGKVDLSDLSIMKYFDKSTPQIFKALVSGQHIPNAVLTAVKAGAGGKPFLKLTLKEMFITSQQASASNEVPTESISFSYNEIKFEYSTQDDSGTLTAVGAVTYNTKKNVTS